MALSGVRCRNNMPDPEGPNICAGPFLPKMSAPCDIFKMSIRGLL